MYKAISNNIVIGEIMKVKVTVTGKYGLIQYFHEVAGEGELSEAIGIAIDQFRTSNPDMSIFETTIKIERA